MSETKDEIETVEQQPQPITTTTTNDTVNVVTNNEVVVESSSQDDRAYSVFELPNKLTCLLVSDATTDKASAAMAVRVGHLCDPEEAPGLAHFCEHMLFMGTKKYPKENEYDAYLSSHGGSSNAYTDTECTVFYFDINHDYLEPSLDRFAQFFIEPLFNADSTDRELQAVDSEHAKNLQADYWRSFQLLKSLAKPTHPFSKFGSGNLKTLKEQPMKAGLNIRELLLNFHETHYSANVMKLVVLGKESIPELKQMVTSYFSNVVNKNIATPSFPGEPYGKDELSKRLSIVPVCEGVRTLDMNFPTREIETLYKQKPTRYISHLIGHEGVGSILEYLKHKGWANELSAGDSRSSSDWACFTISIDLTDLGFDHVEDVVEVVFAYLSLLKSKGPQQWIHDETATVADCSFRFLSKRNPMDYTCCLVDSMQTYPSQYFLSGPYKIYEYDASLIESILDYFTPENMLMAVTSKQFEGSTESKEFWYGTEYNIEDLPKSLCTRWSEVNPSMDTFDGMLQLPEMNDMIASDFSIIKGMVDVPTDEPKLVVDSDCCRLWYKPDNVFNMPKVNVMAIIRSENSGSRSPEDSVLSLLWVQIFKEHSNDFTYLASMASLYCGVVNVEHGLELNLTGFSQKSHILLKRVVKSMNDLSEKVDEILFQRVKEKTVKLYQNFLFSQPYQHAMKAAGLCLELSKWSIEEKMQALDTLTLQDFIAFSRRLLSRFHLEVLVHGNVTLEDAKSISNVILDGLKPLPPFSSSLPQSRVIQLKDGCDYIHRLPEPNTDNTNSCVEVLYQVGPVELKVNATLALLHHLLREPAYNELRTNEQIGYIVHTSVATNGDAVKGLIFLIQSDSFDPTHIDSRIENFLEGFRSKMVLMSEEDFQGNIDAVVQNFEEKDKNLAEESSVYWSQIANNTYQFKRRALLAAELKNLSIHQVLQFYDKFIAKDAPHRRKLSIHVFAEQHLEKYNDPVEDGITLLKPEDVVEFKRSMPLYALPKKVDVEQFKLTKN